LAGCFWLWFLVFDLVLGIMVVLVVIFGCMGSCCFIFLIRLLLLLFLKGFPGAVWAVYFFGLKFFFGAFSRYPLQSFAPNPGTKGFSLLSGLGQDHTIV